MKSNSSNSNIFFRWMHLCFFRLSPFLRSVHQLSAEFKTNVYTSIVSSCSSEASPTVFLLSGDVRGTQQGLCEALQTAHWSLSACVYTLRCSEKCVCVCVFFFSESGFLSCSFDDGLCGWIRDKDGDLHWETTPDPSGTRKAGLWSHWTHSF